MNMFWTFKVHVAIVHVHHYPTGREISSWAYDVLQTNNYVTWPQKSPVCVAAPSLDRQTDMHTDTHNPQYLEM